MTAFLGFVVKEFKQILRDRRTMLVLFGMPIAQLIIFGFAIRNEVNNVKVAVLDFANDEVTREIVQKVDASEAFELAALLESYSDVERVFRQGKIKEVIVFEANFGDKLKSEGKAAAQIITDATDPNLANLVQNYTGAIIRNYLIEQNQLVYVDGEPPGINTIIQMRYNPELKSVNLFVPGLIAVILMLVSALMTSISITREKEMGNMEILLVSPLKPVQIIVGKVIPYLVLSLVNVVTILVLAKFIFDVPFRGNLVLFFAEAFLFIVTALALGVFISTVANNQQTAMMASLAGLLLPTVLLSGFIFPVDSMPVALQWFSHLIPAKWFLVIVRGIMLKGAGILLLWKETMILAGTAFVFLALSVKKFNVRLQ